MVEKKHTLHSNIYFNLKIILNDCENVTLKSLLFLLKIQGVPKFELNKIC